MKQLVACIVVPLAICLIASCIDITRNVEKTFSLTREALFTEVVNAPIFSISLSDDAKRGIVNTSKTEPSKTYTDRGTSHAMYKFDLDSEERMSLKAQFPGRSILASTITHNGAHIAFGLSDGSYLWWPFVDGDGQHWRKTEALSYLAPGSRPESVVAIDNPELNGYGRDDFSEFDQEGETLRLHLKKYPSVIRYNRKRSLAAFNIWGGRAEVRRVPSYELITGLAPQEDFGDGINLADDIDFSVDSRLLALSGDGGFCIWDLENKRICAEVINPKIAVITCRFMRDGKHLLCAEKIYSHAANDRPQTPRVSRISVWNIATTLPTLEGSFNFKFYSLAMSQDGTRVCFSHGERNRSLTYAKLHITRRTK